MLVATIRINTHILVYRAIVEAACSLYKGRIIVGCAVYAKVCIPVQYAIIASTYCMQ